MSPDVRLVNARLITAAPRRGSITALRGSRLCHLRWKATVMEE
jgi:hypothetical protein